MKENLTNSLTNSILKKFLESPSSGLPKESKDKEYIVSQVGNPKSFCVGIIDIIDSTKSVASIPSNKTARYYEIYLNTMAKTVTQFNGYILKTMGDSLLFYFPDTCYSDRKFGFLSCIECGFSLMNAHTKLNHELESEDLPRIDYRISFDYGIVTVMKTAEESIDLVGPTINTCAKINYLSPPNEIIIGNDLYEKTKGFHEYKFKKAGNYTSDQKFSYPIYSVLRAN